MGGPAHAAAIAKDADPDTGEAMLVSRPAVISAEVRPFGEQSPGPFTRLAYLEHGFLAPVAFPSSARSDPSRTPGGLPYFDMPTRGFNWAQLHNYNAVDIANECGTPIQAAADGLVIGINMDRWSDGYGHNVLLQHPNGTRTRYAHLDSILVSLGNYVRQNEQIATMGSTGDSTGCHLHFEVIGAKNPFAGY